LDCRLVTLRSVWRLLFRATADKRVVISETKCTLLTLTVQSLQRLLCKQLMKQTFIYSFKLGNQQI